MSAAFLIIDGYNLLHEAGLSQAKYASGDLHRQRHRLLVRLTNELSAEERIRCTVVFDAIEAPSGLERQFRHGEIAVMFAEPGHDADSLIEELLVVSSDHRLQKAAKQRRGKSVDSEEFLQQLATRAREAAKAKPAKPSVTSTGSSQEETSYWLNEFGKIDVDAIGKLDDPDAKTAATDQWQKNLDDLQKQLNEADLDEWLKSPPPDRRKK
jgi:predicted RNA-binding protein with PIN domain